MQKHRPWQNSFLVTWSLLMAAVWIAMIFTERVTETSIGQSGWWHRWIINDNGLWEDIEALSLLSAMGIYLWTVLTTKSSRLAYITIGGFLLFLLCVLGEETSWGGVVTLHKIAKEGISLGQMANIAVHGVLIIYGILLPLFATLSASISEILDRMRVPVPSLWFSLWPLLTLLLEVPILSTMLWGRPANELPWSLSEIREAILYLLFLGAVILSAIRWKETKS